MHPTTPPSLSTKKQVEILRKKALSYPEAHEEFPWGHSAFKVRSKAFCFLHADAEGFSLSVKLPESSALALHLPFAEPTGYGLGKSGWVTGAFKNKETAPMPVLLAWLEESYMAIAPKGLVKILLEGGAPTQGATKAAPKKPAAKKPAAKKPAAKKTAAKKPTAKKAARRAPASKSSTRR